MRLTINGIDFTKEADLSSVQITAGLNEADNTINVTSTDTIKLSGKAAKYVNNVFFSNPCEGKKQELRIGLYDPCCKLWFDFVADARGIKKCPNCKTEIVLSKRDSDNCYEKLKSKVFWENGFKDAYKHPQVWYVNRPPAFILLYLIGVVIASIIRVIFEICRFWDRVVNLVTFGGKDIDCSPIERALCNMSEYISGNNWKSPSPYIKDILEYNAKLCGLKLKSSIFQQSIYKDAVLFQQQYTRGRKNASNWIEDNGANLTVLQLLDKLKPVFNLDYRIQGGFLIVERKDYFDNSNNVLFDFSGEDYCVNFDMQNEYANAQYSYQDDAVDQEGNSNYLDYDDRVEWNAENSTWKKGTLTQQNDFGRARFMYDRISYEKDGIFDFDLTGDLISSNGLGVFISGLCKNNTTRRNNDMILSDHTAQNLKILVLEPNTNMDDAKVIKRKSYTRSMSFLGFNFGSVQFYDYNYPMWYKESEPNGLYQNFHSIDDPKNNNSKLIEIDDIDIDYSDKDCDKIKSIIDNPSGMAVRFKEGVAIPTNWSIDITGKKLKLSGLRVRCK